MISARSQAVFDLFKCLIETFSSQINLIYSLSYFLPGCLNSAARNTFRRRALLFFVALKLSLLLLCYEMIIIAMK